MRHWMITGLPVVPQGLIRLTVTLMMIMMPQAADALPALLEGPNTTIRVLCKGGSPNDADYWNGTDARCNSRVLASSGALIKPAAEMYLYEDTSGRLALDFTVWGTGSSSQFSSSAQLFITLDDVLHDQVQGTARWLIETDPSTYPAGSLMRLNGMQFGQDGVVAVYDYYFDLFWSVPRGVEPISGTVTLLSLEEGIVPEPSTGLLLLTGLLGLALRQRRSMR